MSATTWPPRMRCCARSCWVRWGHSECGDWMLRRLGWPLLSLWVCSGRRWGMGHQPAVPLALPPVDIAACHPIAQRALPWARRAARRCSCWRGRARSCGQHNASCGRRSSGPRPWRTTMCSCRPASLVGACCIACCAVSLLLLQKSWGCGVLPVLFTGCLGSLVLLGGCS